MNTDTTPDTREDHQRQEEERSRRRRRFESLMIKARAEEAQKEQQQELENTQREREAWDETIAHLQELNAENDFLEQLHYEKLDAWEKTVKTLRSRFENEHFDR